MPGLSERGHGCCSQGCCWLWLAGDGKRSGSVNHPSKDITLLPCAIPIDYLRGGMGWKNGSICIILHSKSAYSAFSAAREVSPQSLEKGLGAGEQMRTFWKGHSQVSLPGAALGFTPRRAFGGCGGGGTCAGCSWTELSTLSELLHGHGSSFLLGQISSQGFLSTWIHLPAALGLLWGCRHPLKVPGRWTKVFPSCPTVCAKCSLFSSCLGWEEFGRPGFPGRKKGAWAWWQEPRC